MGGKLSGVINVEGRAMAKGESCRNTKRAEDNVSAEIVYYKTSPCEFGLGWVKIGPSLYRRMGCLREYRRDMNIAMNVDGCDRSRDKSPSLKMRRR
jgi:hypothetical protein